MRYLLLAVPLLCLIAVSCDQGGSGTIMDEGAPPPLYRGDRPNTTVIALHSSPSRHWATPAIGVSENHYHLLAYDGVDAGKEYGPRSRAWLRVDKQSHVATGGTTQASTIDNVPVYDQAVAGRGSVVAVVYPHLARIVADVSVDGGLTFPFRGDLGAYDGMGQTRLDRAVAVAVSPDLQISFAYWRGRMIGQEFSSELVVVDATPQGFNAGVPTGYSFSGQAGVHLPGVSVTAMVMHAEYSEAGDLVIGYGYSGWMPDQAGVEETLTASYRIAIRSPLTATFADSELDVLFGETREIPPQPEPPPPPMWNEVEPIGIPEPPPGQDVPPPMPPPPPAGAYDPHVCLIGSGPDMQIFYAYDKPTGVELLHSTDAGQSFYNVSMPAMPGAYLPRVHARMSQGKLRIDLLFLRRGSASGGEIHELHNYYWRDYIPLAHARTYVVTPVSGWYRKAFVATTRFGYDSVLDGDKVAAVIHERRYRKGDVGVFSLSANPIGDPPAPPVMDNFLPPVEDAHHNQIRLAILE